MPKGLKTMAKKAGVGVKDAERYWREAKKSCKRKGVKDFYACVMGVTKKRIGYKKKKKKTAKESAGSPVEQNMISENAAPIAFLDPKTGKVMIDESFLMHATVDEMRQLLDREDREDGLDIGV